MAKGRGPGALGGVGGAQARERTASRLRPCEETAAAAAEPVAKTHRPDARVRCRKLMVLSGMASFFCLGARSCSHLGSR